MYATRKSDLKSFTPNSKSVCRINDGSTNAYLKEDRAIEEFLKTIEPKYNEALAKLIGDKIDEQCIYTIGGFVAYVVFCSPAGMRIQSGPLKSIVETVAATMEARGLIPPPPKELGGESLVELLGTGAVKVKVDPKFPQAIGISSIRRSVAIFGNSRWDILLDGFNHSPFFTSDFPAAIEETRDRLIINRIVPLAPNLAIRIRPDLTIDRGLANFSFANFHCRRRSISQKEAVDINRLIVRCRRLCRSLLQMNPRLDGGHPARGYPIRRRQHRHPALAKDARMGHPHWQRFRRRSLTLGHPPNPIKETLKMTPQQLSIARESASLWRVTFNNPPINMFVPTTIVELGALMTDLEADPAVKVVVFQSANPDFFIAHLDVAKAAERPEVLGLWRDFVLRLSSAPVVSLAKIRGRTRGIGNEFVLACDMRFASRQSALFGNPEVGVGLVPGGGAMEWLPRLVGRSRALEIVLSGDDFDADIAERYGWVNRTLDDGELDSFVDTLARRVASFDRETLSAAKAQINRFGTPIASEIQSSIDLFFPLLALPGAQARRAKIRDIGYGVPSDFELNFGRYLPSFGRADDDDPDSPKIPVDQGV